MPWSIVDDNFLVLSALESTNANECDRNPFNSRTSRRFKIQIYFLSKFASKLCREIKKNIVRHATMDIQAYQNMTLKWDKRKQRNERKNQHANQYGDW